MTFAGAALAAACCSCSLRCAFSEGVVVACGPWSSGRTSFVAGEDLAASSRAACRRAMTSLLALSCAIIWPASLAAQDGAAVTRDHPSTQQCAKARDNDNSDFVCEVISNTSFNAGSAEAMQRPRVSVEISRPLTRRPIRIWRG